MNETTKTGIRRAIHAAWDKLPEALTAAVVALVVFGFGLWIDGRDMRLDLDHVMAEQQSVRFCERVSTCPCVAGTASALADCKHTIALSREHIESHNREAEQWKQRIIRIEQQLFEMSRSQ